MNRAMTAQEVLDRYWDGVTLPVPLISIANKMGISVFKRQDMAYSGEVSIGEDGLAKIVFNTDEPTVRQRFTVAHEIGHVALGHVKPGGKEFRDEAKDFFSSVRSPNEVAANKFAAELLMPADSVRFCFLKMGSLSVDEIAKVFNVSTAALRYRLINLGLIRG